LVKISPFAIDKLDIALHNLITLLADFQQAFQQLEGMDLYDWKKTARHNLTGMMREFLNLKANPTL